MRTLPNYFRKPTGDPTFEGPYECPRCHGHVMLDSSFLEQVSLRVTCPYCRSKVEVIDEED